MKYEREILKVMHKEAKEMYKIGAISEARMREYGEMCLSNPKTKNKSSPVYTDDNSADIKQISHATA
jgi:DNA-binding transcriptional regulator YiaG